MRESRARLHGLRVQGLLERCWREDLVQWIYLAPQLARLLCRQELSKSSWHLKGSLKFPFNRVNVPSLIDAKLESHKVEVHRLSLLTNAHSPPLLRLPNRAPHFHR